MTGEEIVTVLNWLQSFHILLRDWGIATELVIVLALIATGLLFYSFREILAWYFKIPALTKEVASLNQQLTSLRESLEAMKKELQAGNAEAPEVKSEEPKFLTLDH